MARVAESKSNFRGGERSMEPEQLEPRCWYWIRRDDGSLSAYLFHALKRDEEGRTVAEFFVGSMLHTWPLGRILGKAEAPLV